LAVTVYAELLKLALTEEDRTGWTVDQLAAEAVRRCHALAATGEAADRLAASLAYDTVLVELCRRLDVPHDLLGDQAGPAARSRAERSLGSVVPLLDGMVR
jgi:hypothetical protein